MKDYITDVSQRKFYLEITFLTGHLRATASDKYLNSNCNSNKSILIYIVGTLYLMIRNLDLVFMIDHVFRG